MFATRMPQGRTGRCTPDVYFSCLRLNPTIYGNLGQPVAMCHILVTLGSDEMLSSNVLMGRRVS